MVGGPGSPSCAYYLCGIDSGSADDPFWSTKNTIVMTVMAAIPVADVARALGITSRVVADAAYPRVETSTAAAMAREATIGAIRAANKIPAGSSLATNVARVVGAINGALTRMGKPTIDETVRSVTKWVIGKLRPR